MSAATARARHLARCDYCGQLNALAAVEPSTPHCQRCHSELQLRRRHSLQRCWALCLSATLLLLPANTLPILTVIHFGKGSPDTIMSGVISLWRAELQGIALIVFVASILVPVLKLLVLFFLCIAVQFRLPLKRAQCTLLYRVVHAIGRWSMIDLFMISVLVTLVSLGNIATVETGPGATAFAAVVVLTLYAAEQFDPRLLWDLHDVTE